MRSVAISRSSASTRSTMLASSLASLARQRSSMPLSSAAAMTACSALARQKDAALLERLAHAGDAELQLLVLDLARRRRSARATSHRRRRPRACRPGNTSAPEKASILWWRTTMNTSSGELPSPAPRAAPAAPSWPDGPAAVLSSAYRSCTDCHIPDGTVEKHRHTVRQSCSAMKGGAPSTTNNGMQADSLGAGIAGRAGNGLRSSASGRRRRSPASSLWAAASSCDRHRRADHRLHDADGGAHRSPPPSTRRNGPIESCGCCRRPLCFSPVSLAL